MPNFYAYILHDQGQEGRVTGACEIVVKEQYSSYGFLPTQNCHLNASLLEINQQITHRYVGLKFLIYSAIRDNGQKKKKSKEMVRNKE